MMAKSPWNLQDCHEILKDFSGLPGFSLHAGLIPQDFTGNFHGFW